METMRDDPTSTHTGGSGDFVWETDTSGRFSFVRASAALGYDAAALIGRRPSVLLRAETTEDRAALFCGRGPVAGADVWLYTADGDDICLRLSASPVFGEDGRWLGMRGTGRDVTGLKAREAGQTGDRLVAVDA